MAVLQSKLLERRRQEEQAKINALKGDNSGSWGNQMRSYVLAPYQMVKDLRNNHETGNTTMARACATRWVTALAPTLTIAG
jgi:peptide chain release factor 2